MTKITVAESDKNKLIRHIITACGYLVRWGPWLTLPELAAAIRRHLTGQRAEAVAVALESAMGFVVRDWCGLRMNWQC